MDPDAGSTEQPCAVAESVACGDRNWSSEVELTEMGEEMGI